MLNSIIGTAKPRLFSILRSATIIALLAAAVPTTFAHAAGSTSSGLPSVTLTSADSGALGQALPVTLTVTNSTQDTVTQTLLNMQFAGQITGLSNPGACGRARRSGVETWLSCDAGTLAPGASFSISLGILPAFEGQLGISSGASGLINGVTNSSSTGLSVPIAAGASDVQISGTSSTGSPAAGTNFHYNYQVRNSGSYVAHAVTFTDTVPAGMTLIAAVAGNFAPCTLSGNTVSCRLGEIAVGSQVLINVGVGAPGTPATLTNTARADATNADTQPSNNSVSITVQVR